MREASGVDEQREAGQSAPEQSWEPGEGSWEYGRVDSDVGTDEEESAPEHSQFVQALLEGARLTKENERLRRLLQILETEWSAEVERVKAAQAAEIARFRADNDRLAECWDVSIEAESVLAERLRALEDALKRIESFGVWELSEDDAYSMQRIARVARESQPAHTTREEVCGGDDLKGGTFMCADWPECDHWVEPARTTREGDEPCHGVAQQWCDVHGQVSWTHEGCDEIHESERERDVCRSVWEPARTTREGV